MEVLKFKEEILKDLKSCIGPVIKEETIENSGVYSVNYKNVIKFKNKYNVKFNSLFADCFSLNRKQNKKHEFFKENKIVIRGSIKELNLNTLEDFIYNYLIHKRFKKRVILMSIYYDLKIKNKEGYWGLNLEKNKEKIRILGVILNENYFAPPYQELSLVFCFYQEDNIKLYKKLHSIEKGSIYVHFNESEKIAC